MFVSKRRSAKSSKHQDYISPFRFILKTCGTTTPLDCIEELTKLVKEYAGFNTVEV
jgi:S-adenosylmethionine decarboxylase